MMKLLLEYKTDYDYHYRELHTKKGNTPLHIAVERNDVECAKVLLDGCRNRVFFIQNSDFVSVDELICKMKHKNNESEMINIISSRKEELGGKEYATTNGFMRDFSTNVENPTLLLSELKQSPFLLENAVLNEWKGVKNGIAQYIMHFICGKDDPNAVKSLLDIAAANGCELHREVKSSFGITPLHLAAFSGKIENVKVLLEGCRSEFLDYRDIQDGFNAVDEAKTTGFEDVAQLILKKKDSFENKNIIERKTLKGLIALMKFLYGAQCWKCYRCQTSNVPESDICNMCNMVKDQDVTKVPMLFEIPPEALHLPWGRKEDILTMKELIDDYSHDKDLLISKLISKSSNIPYKSSSVLLSPLHICAGFNLNVIESIMDHPLLLNCLMMFERNEWGCPILNVAAALDHQNAFSVILNYYVNYPFETLKRVVFDVAPIVFARNNPPVMAILLAQFGAEIQNDDGDTIAHIIARSKKKDAHHFRSKLIRLGFVPSQEFTQDRLFMTKMINDILCDPVCRQIKNKLGKTPIHVAMANKKKSMVLELLKGTDRTSNDIKDEVSELRKIDKMGHFEIIGCVGGA
eukprot:TRINITY_DN1748_c0_g1_i7.p1 TRINITY_DN1748_c0_g1~~TRINITY_DN1748_c0_g1_i7.p1  ORF type:complete len:577 (-),score=107.96 TRINITY_DN1748_c0_g1_i7:58-1788(-)